MQIALERLRDVEREYLFLAVVEGYTADEIGQMTGTSRGTVLSILHRSKAKLRKILAEHAGDGSNDPPARADKVSGSTVSQSAPVQSDVDPHNTLHSDLEKRNIEKKINVVKLDVGRAH